MIIASIAEKVFRSKKTRPFESTVKTIDFCFFFYKTPYNLHVFHYGGVVFLTKPSDKSITDIVAHDPIELYRIIVVSRVVFIMHSIIYIYIYIKVGIPIPNLCVPI